MKRTFEQWLKEVNDLLIKTIGIGIDDLPDCSYYDWYESGKAPKSAAKSVLKNSLSC